MSHSCGKLDRWKCFKARQIRVANGHVRGARARPPSNSEKIPWKIPFSSLFPFVFKSSITRIAPGITLFIISRSPPFLFSLFLFNLLSLLLFSRRNVIHACDCDISFLSQRKSNGVLYYFFNSPFHDSN